MHTVKHVYPTLIKRIMSILSVFRQIEKESLSTAVLLC